MSGPPRISLVEAKKWKSNEGKDILIRNTQKFDYILGESDHSLCSGSSVTYSVTFLELPSEMENDFLKQCMCGNWWPEGMNYVTSKY